MRFAAIVLAWLLAVVSPAHAQERQFPPVYVFGERDLDSSLRDCGVSHPSSVAQVQSTLRMNRVVVLHEVDPVNMYVNINAFPISASGGMCAYSLTLTFGSFGQAFVESTGETILGPVRFCEKGSLLVWSHSRAQSQINTTFASFVNECLTEYQSLYRR